MEGGARDSRGPRSWDISCSVQGWGCCFRIEASQLGKKEKQPAWCLFSEQHPECASTLPRGSMEVGGQPGTLDAGVMSLVLKSTKGGARDRCGEALPRGHSLWALLVHCGSRQHLGVHPGEGSSAPTTEAFCASPTQSLSGVPRDRLGVWSPDVQIGRDPERSYPFSHCTDQGGQTPGRFPRL